MQSKQSTFLSKKTKNIGFFLFCIFGAVVVEGVKNVADMLIHASVVVGIVLGVVVVCSLVFFLLPYTRRYMANKKGHKFHFVFVSVFCFSVIGLGVLDTFAFINNHPKNNDMKSYMCPILSAKEPGGKQAQYSAKIKLRGRERTVVFSHTEKNSILLEAKYINVVIARGVLGYDYIHSKTIVK